MAAIEGVPTEVRKRKLCEASAGVRDLPPITQIAWGNGGVDENGIPKKVTGAEISLSNELMRKDIETIAFVNDAHTTCRYSGTLGNDDLINQEISEAALFDSENDMASIGTFLRKGKDEGMPQQYQIDEIFV